MAFSLCVGATSIATGGVKTYGGGSTSETDSSGSPATVDESGAAGLAQVDPLASDKPIGNWALAGGFDAPDGRALIGVRLTQGWDNLAGIRLTFDGPVKSPSLSRLSRVIISTNPPIFGDPLGTGQPGWYFTEEIDLGRYRRMRMAAFVIEGGASQRALLRGGTMVDRPVMITATQSSESGPSTAAPDPTAPTAPSVPAAPAAPAAPVVPTGSWPSLDTFEVVDGVGLVGVRIDQGVDDVAAVKFTFVKAVYSPLLGRPGRAILTTDRMFGDPFGTGEEGWYYTAQIDLGTLQRNAVAGFVLGPTSRAITIKTPGQMVGPVKVINRVAQATAPTPPDPTGGNTTPPAAPPSGGDTTAPTAPAGGIPTAPSVAPVLVPGNGFGSATRQPANVGTASSAGFDAQAIARWDVVPYQEFQSIFEIGVVAFHINGIDRVEFSVDNGPWTAVRAMGLNGRTGVWEYSVALDASVMSDGLHEIRAVVYPSVAGEPRVLAGPIENTTKFVSGEHSIFLSSDAGDTLQNPIRYVDSSNGSDSTGDGTSSNPFATPSRALQDLQADLGSCDGATVYCYPGDYSWEAVGWPPLTTESRWVTITPASGVSRDRVVFNNGKPGGFKLGHIRALGVTFLNTSNAAWSIRGRLDDVVWIDHCRAIGPGPQFARKLYNGRGVVTSLYCTGNEISGWNSGIRSADFYRDNLIYDISGSPFGATHFAVNNTCRDYKDPSNFHGDVFHWFNAADEENFVIYGLNVFNFSSQGIFAEAGTRWPGRMDEVAIVNTHISKDDGDLAAGSWWQKSTNHLLIWNTSLPDQVFRWRLSAAGTSVQNLSLRNNIFMAFSLDKSNIPPNADIRHNHFIDLSLWQSWRTNGLNETLGDPGFTDSSALDYRPLPGSILSDRVPIADRTVTADIEGVVRPNSTNSTVGPWEK